MALQPIWAHADITPAESAVTGDVALRIHIIEEPGPAQPRATSAKGYVLQVTNAAGAPVTGAAVALRLPEDGATGRFNNGLRAWVAYSDSAGIVRFPVLQWGETAGVVQIQVTAAKGSSHTGLLIAQRLGSDGAAVSVVSVPVYAPASETTTPASVAPTVVATPRISENSLGTPHRIPLGFDMPQVETAQAAAPKPAAPRAPQVALETPAPGTVFQPLADVPPAETPNRHQDAPPISMNTSSSGASPGTGKVHPLVPDPPAPTKEDSSEPMVSITNSPTGASSGESHKKIWILNCSGRGCWRRGHARCHVCAQHRQLQFGV